ncbi:MAG: deoxyribonuclease IV [Gemmatimonadetes bacterium]|nr:deoxyribonuclease IV [Gemmatimonadota bacterium]
MKGPASRDELGAHVSVAGGIRRAPGRGREIGACVLQLFTKQPNRWREPRLDPEERAAFRAERRSHGIRIAIAHDSYLINLASPDPALYRRSLEAFIRELERCALLELKYLVTHPGHATDGDRESGLARNADALARALSRVPAPTVVLLETTAGTGHALGASFEELAYMIRRVPHPLRRRLGVCLDTCHVYAAGYDLVRDYDGVLREFDALIGLGRLRLFHLNDSRHPLASRKDRHEQIGQGSLGELPFRRIMTDPRFGRVPKIIETPKEGAGVLHDTRNLRLLRSFRGPESLRSS